MMDGCGYFRYFFYITLPLSGPILSTVAVISFVASWNGYLLPLVVLNSELRYPWTLGLMAYQGQYSTSWQLVLAFITLDDPAGDRDVPDGAALHRRRADRGRGQGVTARFPSRRIFKPQNCRSPYPRSRAW